MQVGVEKVTLNGRVRITLKPLMDEMPIVAAMQVRRFHWHLLIAFSGQQQKMMMMTKTGT